MKRSRFSPFFWVAMIATAYLAGILLVKNQYYQLMMTLVPVWATMGLSWNILSGYSGLVSLCKALSYPIAAEATGIGHLGPELEQPNRNERIGAEAKTQ